MFDPKKRRLSLEYMNSWQRFNKTSLPDVKEFYSNSKIENITHEDYDKIVWEDFELKAVGDYHDLNLQSDNLLLVDIFENFHNKCIEL